ncbi:hypothetical protein COCOBI_14-4720 [Coccomyxa sp. Obi]|nr:hypothetical protein COCOBI_14-4720 [Coccomyxa sp. Obi]
MGLSASKHAGIAGRPCSGPALKAPSPEVYTSSICPEDPLLKKQVVAAALHLKEHGWAIVDDVLTREECEAYVEGVWDWLEGLGTGINRSDPSTWTGPQWVQSFKGIINSLEVAHQDFVWRVRKHPRLVQIFEMLWGTNELLSSFDSINVTAPSAKTGTPHDTASWLHVDQAPLRRGFFCVQGIVNLVDVSGDTSGTLLVKDRTHSEHAHFFDTASSLTREQQEALTHSPAGPKDFYVFKPEEVPHWDCFETLPLAAKAGSVFLWDSRTVHANTIPQFSEDWRHVVYACYQPRALATEKDLAAKRKAWDDYAVTTHWPAANVSITSGLDYVGGAGGKAGDRPRYALRRTRDAVDDRTLRQLAGVEPYQATDIRLQPALLELSEEDLRAMLQ